MSEMVERVAKAIYTSMTIAMGRSSPEDWEDVGPDHDRARAGWLFVARAAIEAMREPTEAMREAGYTGGGEDSYAVAEGAWEAMIDAALQDKTTEVGR